MKEIRNKITEDPNAVKTWEKIVGEIISLPADKLRIESELKAGNYEEAILQTIQIWHQYWNERPDLLNVFRNHGLHDLAGDSYKFYYSLVFSLIKLLNLLSFII